MSHYNKFIVFNYYLNLKNIFHGRIKIFYNEKDTNKDKNRIQKSDLNYYSETYF